MTPVRAFTLVFCILTGLTGPVGLSHAGELIAPDTRLAFPTVKGRSLTGDKFTLPGGLKGEINVVILAFTREQQPAAQSWFNQLDALSRQYEGLEYYEVPLLRRYGMFRKHFIKASLKSDIRTTARRKRTIVVYTKKDWFLKGAGLPDDSQVQVLVVDQLDRIAWHTDGGHTPDKLWDLEMAVRDLLDEEDSPLPGSSDADPDPTDEATGLPAWQTPER